MYMYNVILCVAGVACVYSIVGDVLTVVFIQVLFV